MLEVTATEDGFEFYLNEGRIWCRVELYDWLESPPENDENGLAHVEFFNDFSIGVYQTP
jgi:hypothetical protein